MTLGEILQNEINSALVTFENHNSDNSFMDCDITTFARLLEASHYEPVGICKNVPFEPSYARYSVAFCYKYEDELYWCHLTEIIWFSLLSDVYGRDKADEIISRIMGYSRKEH